jgi:hypothetical protein
VVCRFYLLPFSEQNVGFETNVVILRRAVLGRAPSARLRCQIRIIMIATEEDANASVTMLKALIKSELMRHKFVGICCEVGTIALLRF